MPPLTPIPVTFPFLLFMGRTVKLPSTLRSNIILLCLLLLAVITENHKKSHCKTSIVSSNYPFYRPMSDWQERIEEDKGKGYHISLDRNAHLR